MHDTFNVFSERLPIYALSCMTISGERTEQHVVIYFIIYLLHGLYRTLSHSQSEESQLRGGHKSVSENPAVKFSF